MTTQRMPFDPSSLSETERLLLAQALLDSVLFPPGAAELSPAQHAELHARMGDIDNGRVACETWEAARKRLWNRM